MLRGVLIGVLVLVVAVFAYVGYSSYATNRVVAGAETYSDGMMADRSRPEPRRARREEPADSLPADPTADAEQPPASPTRLPAASAPQELPASTPDTIAPNPPNGMTFGGSGHFQLYRQGDLTWRLNTDTGDTCVLLATNQEWRKPQVYKSGCRGK